MYGCEKMTRVHLTVLVVAILARAGYSVLDETPLNVVPFEVAVQAGENVTFVCVPKEGAVNHSEPVIYHWARVNLSNPNITHNLTSGDKFSVVNETLSILLPTKSEEGAYRCTLGNLTSDGILIIYHMPDYLVEGAVIGAICLLLFVLLTAGIVIAFMRQYRARKARQNKRREKDIKNGFVPH
ncbi:uncharacterized protein LOC131953529 [Physella acuta]|uniref:uncharacterized protein LOC131953529 n=1 Tax=Physella acuta TaxID=109671 RepID=UPI0027DCDFCC|nr:uncharacterized protein LOC131953529 [Physella acuta]XP_059172727.1 uncharacterized protein LOC131953529 [Physella acuta]XP_059172728.1 uncharacterized protein LOC131953529 [Physella acuta]XP_059172729.1 uncharacterized protein LOC131953529 [Physella acuta]XP_059172730.1 uncharacterized protein LOC131953529 [Physella acuta]